MIYCNFMIFLYTAKVLDHFVMKQLKGGVILSPPNVCFVSAVPCIDEAVMGSLYTN